MLGEEIGKEEGHIEYEFLTGITGIGIGLGDVRGWRDHSVDGSHDHGEQDDKLGVVFRADF